MDGEKEEGGRSQSGGKGGDLMTTPHLSGRGREGAPRGIFGLYLLGALLVNVGRCCCGGAGASDRLRLRCFISRVQLQWTTISKTAPLLRIYIPKPGLTIIAILASLNN